MSVGEVKRLAVAALCGTVFTVALGSPCWAQKDAPEPGGDEVPKAVVPPNPEAKKGKANLSEAEKAFDEKFKEWKGVMVEMRKKRLDFTSATPEVREKLRGEFNELVGRGLGILKELRDAGLKALVESESPDPQVVRFMESLVGDAANNDDMEVAYEHGKPILEKLDQAKITPSPIMLAALAVASFSQNDFELADSIFKRLKASEELDPNANPSARKLVTAAMSLGEQIPETRKKWDRESKLREAEAKADDLPRVKIETNAGTMVVELFENEAPETVGNFISLVEKGFYTDLNFHRVIANFMAQGGCPKGDGTGNPGYKIYDECGSADARKHFRGVLSMANAGPDTGGSQFFINFVATPMLDGKHTVFGRVVEGLDVLAKIKKRDPEQPTGIAPTRIIKMEVVRKRDHAYAPRKVE